MANTSNFYDAEIIKSINGQLVKARAKIDLLSLSGLEFDKIIINADVNLGNGKKADLPDFTNVEINGEFDCSNFIIKSNSVLPSGITALKCFYSVNSLDVLNGILPDTIRSVYVQNSLINSAKKDEELLNKARQFIEQNSNIEVLGKSEKLRLRDLFVQKSEPDTKPVVREKTVQENKTSNTGGNGNLTISAVADNLKKLDKYNGIAIRDLKKMVKTFLYNHNHDNYWGTLQNHVHESKINELAVALLDPKYAEPVKVEQEVIVEEQAPVTQQATEKRSRARNQEDLKPVKIQKYFYKSVLGYVQKVCKSNKKLWVEFLNNINDVNLNPLQNCERIGTCRVGCLKNGELKLVPNLEMKNFTYIMQGFGRANNRPRVVWCVLSGDLLVAGDYFDNHGDGKNKHAYNDTIQSTLLRDKIQADFQKNPQNYISVTDLLAELERLNNKQVQKPEVKPEEPVQETVQEEPVQETDAVVAENNIQVAEPASKIVPEIVSEPAVNQVQEEPEKVEVKSVPAVNVASPVNIKDELPEPVKQESVQNVENKLTDNNDDVSVEKEFVTPVRKRRRPRILASSIPEPVFKDEVLYRASYELEDVLSLINKDIIQIKQELINESDTAKSLALTNQLSSKLQDKSLLEQNMEVAKKAFEIFKRYTVNRNKIR